MRDAKQFSIVLLLPIIVTVALFARCSSVVDEPVGRSGLDKIFLLGFQKLPHVDRIDGESYVTSSVYASLLSDPNERNFIAMLRGAFGQDVVTEWRRDRDFIKVAKVVEKNPIGIDAKTVSVEELRGLYFFLLHAFGGSVNRGSVPAGISDAALAAKVSELGLALEGRRANPLAEHGSHTLPTSTVHSAVESGSQVEKSSPSYNEAVRCAALAHALDGEKGLKGADELYVSAKGYAISHSDSIVRNGQSISLKEVQSEILDAGVELSVESMAAKNVNGTTVDIDRSRLLEYKSQCEGRFK